MAKPWGRTMTKLNEDWALSRRRIIKGTAALVAGVAAPAFLRIRSAYAAYPDRPIKIVVANTPGGPSDLVGRITAAALEQSTGKTFIIENRGGAGSNIGMGYVARSDPDGYTILLATNAYSVNSTLYNSIPYDPLKDFVGVSELATSPNTFVVKSDLSAKTVKEFVALARANPEKFNCATPPIGTTPQIQLEVLKLRENLPKLEDVVFKGGGDAIQALLSGTTQLSSGSLPPLNTTSSSLGRFSRSFKTSSWICGVVPIGGVAQLNFSGLALASATNSFTVFADKSDLTTKVLGEVASSLTPTKSLRGSYGIEL